MRLLVTDGETYKGFSFWGFKDIETGKKLGLEYSVRHPDFDRARLRRLLLNNTHITYNGLGYDLPMMWYATQEGVTPDMLKEASDRIILGNLKWWEIEDALDIRIPWEVRNNIIDLMEPQPNAKAGLKQLAARMHKKIQELPLDPAAVPTSEQMDGLIHYCLHSDLEATHALWDTLKEPMDLRRVMSEDHKQNFMSKSDSQIGEAIVKKRVQEMTGRKPERVETPPGTTFRYPVPDWMEFKTPQMQSILERIRETDFVIKPDGKVNLPSWLSREKISLGSSIYQMGIGGLHSTESNRSLKSDDKFVLVDADVASQYPSIILSLGLYPKALGENFLKIYRGIYEDRLRAKARAKEIKRIIKKSGSTPELERELEKCKVADKSGKIFLNGIYGKLGSRYSILYAPHLLISTTLTGQLTLLMLAEQSVLAGIDVVSGNTDGVLFKCPREHFAGIEADRLNPCKLAEITGNWEKLTGYNLEFAEYSAIYNSSVNTYYAIKADGGHKRKGPLGNPWNKHPDDLDPVRGQLMKNPSATICSDAALAMIKEGIPVETTIRASQDIREFVSVVQVSKGAKWREERIGKVVRFYWSTDGDEIKECVANENGTFKKVSKSHGAVPVQDLPDEFPPDIDYDRYIQEAEDILRDVGFYGDIVPKRKPIRLTKKNKIKVLSVWATCP